jgi:hypothetical protein
MRLSAAAGNSAAGRSLENVLCPLDPKWPYPRLKVAGEQEALSYKVLH